MPPGPVDLAPVGLALAVLVLALARRRALSRAMRRIARAERAGFGALQALHSGLVGDDVAWMAVGLALFAIACAAR